MNEQNIKLTEEETAIIYRCRQKQRVWAIWGRFGVLFMGIFEVIDGLFIIAKLSKLDNRRFSFNVTEEAVFSQTYLAAFLMLGIGVFLIVLTIRFWNGNPSRKLLLKLADSLIDQEKTSEASPKLSSSK